MTQLVISKGLEETAIRWGVWMGTDMAKRTSRRQVVSYFAPAELAMNAEVSARNQAVEYNVPTEVYYQWEQLFTEAYTASYEETVEECKAKEANRLA